MVRNVGQQRSLEDFQFDLESVLTMSQLVGKSAEERNAASVMPNILAGTKNAPSADSYTNEKLFTFGVPPPSNFFVWVIADRSLLVVLFAFVTDFAVAFVFALVQCSDVHRLRGAHQRCSRDLDVADPFADRRVRVESSL